MTGSRHAISASHESEQEVGLDADDASSRPMIVAINKMDKPEANPDNIRTRLLEHEVIVEKIASANSV